MGRYTSVQTYTDQDSKVAKLSYTNTQNTENNESKEDEKTQSIRLNRVENVMSSIAGAGSGDFHTYRSSRRRELERVAAMEKEHNEKKLKEEFELERKRKIQEFDSKMQKKAEKRRRRKERKKVNQLHAQNDSDSDTKTTNTQNTQNLRETPGGVPAIPNDGTFLAQMIEKLNKKSTNKDTNA